MENLQLLRLKNQHRQKENESTSEEVSSTDTNTDTSSAIMSGEVSSHASSNSSEFAPPVVPSGNTVSKGTTSKGFQIQEINGATYIDGVLIANKTYALPQDFIPTNPDQPVNADRSSTCLDKTLMSAWNTMLKDATAKGLNIYIASGYRSYNYQVNVYNRYVKSDGAAVADTYSSRPATLNIRLVYALTLTLLRTASSTLTKASGLMITATNTASVSASLKAKILLPDISMNHGIFVM